MRSNAAARPPTRPLHPLATMAGLALAAGGEGASLSHLGKGLREAVARDPMEAAVVTVLGGAYLFWIAERDVNPRCRTYEDALVFVSTCLNVGYAQVFATTPAGKAIATAIMTVGPGLVTSFFDTPRAEREPDVSPQLLAVQEKIAEKLDAILTELRAREPR